VDDRKMLAEPFLYTLPDGSKKQIATVGDKYGTLQNVNFKVQSQPYYVIISGNEKLLTNPVAYTPGKKEYETWLQCGLKAYAQTSK